MGSSAYDSSDDKVYDLSDEYQLPGFIKVVREDGEQRWYLQGQLHRDDGPAVILPDGDQYWYQHGKRHRDDGPAIIECDGTQRWYVDDKPHRIDGPASMYADGGYYWWVNGDIVANRQRFRELSGISDEAMDMIILKYGDVD